jgi:hypothetical protein
MSQLLTLIWLKWTLFKNSLRSKKSLAGSIASTVGTIAALAFALLVATGLGFASYGIASLNTQHGLPRNTISIDSFSFLFLIFTGIYLMWATIPLSLGGASQFDAGRLLLYPVSLKKVLAMDMASELASLGSIFAIPAVLAVALGTGIGRGNVGYSLTGALFALAFGVALAKWLSISLGALTRKKRTRGETVLAIVGAALGFGGAFAGQLAPMMLENKELWKALHWSPVGAAVSAVAGAPHGVPFDEYLLALFCLSAYTLLLILVTFWIARRSALGMGGSRKAIGHDEKPGGALRGWRVPLVSDKVGAVLEKELRYATRNAQLRMLGIMPLVLVGLKMMNTRGPMGGGGASRAISGFTRNYGGYTDGMLTALGILYIFMLFSTLYCNSFAYEGSGMRSWVLSPIERSSILLGKNINVMIITAFFCGLFLLLNELIFQDVSFNALVFVALAFVLFGAFFAHVGNWLSIHFPKRMRFGKRMNTSGVAGLFLLPIVAVLGATVFGTVAAGYVTHSYAVKYGTLAVLATVAVAIYFALLPIQGRELARRERDILEAVSGKDDV